MSAHLTPHEIIASALQLPIAEREQLADALQQSLIDPTIDHGLAEPAAEVQAAWSGEIARRIAEVDSGQVNTIPADEAERMIRGDAHPPL
jgi:putative addiction module component (TIGR02574 family)